MPDDQLALIESEIANAVNLAGSIATIIAPQQLPFIVLGQAVAKAIPSLYDDVRALISNQAPTAEKISELATKIQALKNPEQI